MLGCKLYLYSVQEIHQTHAKRPFKGRNIGLYPFWCWE